MTFLTNGGESDCDEAATPTSRRGDERIEASISLLSFVETWMDLETVIQSEVSQKEKNKYRILTHVCGT